MVRFFYVSRRRQYCRPDSPRSLLPLSPPRSRFPPRVPAGAVYVDIVEYFELFVRDNVFPRALRRSALAPVLTISLAVRGRAI